mmetsp:Transcript_123870/g.344765  ORF Transcript_123870/g.344765 Transcript_123870/m.344765 type:complete len:118 (+) Transcript_123870:103-456(+)
MSSLKGWSSGELPEDEASTFQSRDHLVLHTAVGTAVSFTRFWRSASKPMILIATSDSMIYTSKGLCKGVRHPCLLESLGRCSVHQPEIRTLHVPKTALEEHGGYAFVCKGLHLETHG